MLKVLLVILNSVACLGDDDSSACDSISCAIEETPKSSSLLQVRSAQEPTSLPVAEEIEEVHGSEESSASDSHCIWQMAEQCQPSFTYKGVVRAGCIMVDNPTPWCSHHKLHKGDWSVCKYSCFDKFDAFEALLNGTGHAEWLNNRRSNGENEGSGKKEPDLPNRARLPQDECTAPLIRFASMNDIYAVRPIDEGHDPHFPAEASSIAPPGSNCGDAAHDIFASCDKYNEWNTMDKISKSYRFDFRVFNPATGLPAHTDVRQGQLGTCYFLAALASIAYRSPQVISDMFVRREYWDKGIISTSWLVNGVDSIIEVDKTIPAEGNRPYFTTIDPESGAWWPAILEKAWSKIYGSYKATEGGWWEAAAAAITRAPTVTYFHSKVMNDDLWQVLLTASKNQWPMGASTQVANFGLAAGHAYSVLEAWEDQRRGKLVKVRNPWHTNYYKGSVPNPTYGDDTGIFTMAFDEFQVAFACTGVAKVNPSYQVSSKRVYQASGKISGAFSFSLKTNTWFAVSIVWPNHRMLCKTSHPRYSLAVRKEGEKQVFYPEQTSISANAAYVELPSDAGSGTYLIGLSIDFPVNTFIHEVQLNVYADQQVEIETPAIDYSTLMLGMYGAAVKGIPCETVTIADRGIWKVNKKLSINGIPTYESWDGKNFAYYVDSNEKWFMVRQKYFQAVDEGTLWSFGKASIEDIKCGCSDSPNGVRGFTGLGCSDIKGPSVTYSNVRCDADVQYTQVAQAFCPVTCNLETCKTLTMLVSCKSGECKTS